MKVEEAERAGLVSRIVPVADLLDDAIATATTIAEMSLPVAMMAKEAVNRSFESSLREGVLFERRVFHSTFATEDQKEGMSAFIEKRTPNFQHR
jgi:enoyl-CoA hydratase